MKKIFSLLAISAIVLGMASCGGSSESNNPTLKNFKVQVKNMTETSLTLEIEALILDKYFFFDLVTAETFVSNGADYYVKNFYNKINEDHVQPEDLLTKNKVSKSEPIEQGKDYVLCIFYVNDNFELEGDIEHTIISTKMIELPKKELVGGVTLMEVSSQKDIVRIRAKDENEDKYIIRIDSRNLTGSFSAEDFYTQGQEVSGIIKGDTKYPFFRASFTGREGGPTYYIYEGWFDCEDGNRYNLKLTCSYNSYL